jgi:hypothetical protein
MGREISALEVSAKTGQGGRLGGVEYRKRLNRNLNWDGEQ